jgi:Fe-S cluster assembly ATP-binding protein
VMLGGRIVETGGVELAAELHKHGYDRIRRTHPEAADDNQKMVQKDSETPTAPATSS